MSSTGKQKFAVFDIDGTFFRSHLYWEVVLGLARRGKLHPKINARTLELHEAWKSRVANDAFEAFDNETINAIDDLLVELNPHEYDQALKEVLLPVLDHTYMYPKTLLQQLKADGYFILAISGSRIEEVNLFAKHHGFDDWIGQTYERTPDGKAYTGKVFKTYKDKHIILETFVKKHNLTYEGSVAIGDTGSDISILAVVDQPIAFNPNRALLEHAQHNNWKIVLERKSIAYTLEAGHDGYLLAKTD